MIVVLEFTLVAAPVWIEHVSLVIYPPKITELHLMEEKIFYRYLSCFHKISQRDHYYVEVRSKQLNDVVL